MRPGSSIAFALCRLLLCGLFRAVPCGCQTARPVLVAPRGPAQVLDPQADDGSIAVGQRADLLILDQDPLEEIGNTERISSVWQAGRRLVRNQ